MTFRISRLVLFLAGGLLLLAGAHADQPAPGTGTIRGTVTIARNGLALHKARVVVTQLGLTTETDPEGAFQFTLVPEGTYDLIVRSPGLSDTRQTVRVTAGATAQADFAMGLACLVYLLLGEPGEPSTV